MDENRIGVGLIGASPDRSWASGTHVPAIQASPHFTLAAVCTTRLESADAAAKQWNVPAAYTDAGQLVADPGVKLVVVSVKCPDHYAPVRAALDAGKPVLCEWPLAAHIDEVGELASLAQERSIPTFIGLQARAAPALAYARDLIAQGYVGRILGATLVSAAAGRTEITDRAHVFAADKRYGNSALTIAGGHSLDALCFVAGEEFREVSAVVKVHFTQQRVAETGEIIDKNTPDYISVAGMIEGGATVAAHVQAGVTRGPGVRLDFRGTRGDLSISSSGPHIIEMVEELRIEGAQAREGAAPGSWTPLKELTVPASYRLDPSAALSGSACNVAQLYALISSDLRQGTRLAPDFQVALRRHTLLDAIERSSESRRRQELA
jgi:predicted dehydrogenase